MPRQHRLAPWLDQRKGVWGVNEYDPAARRTKRTGLRTRDQAEALRRFAAHIATGGRPAVELAGDAGLTVAQALDDYYKEHVARNVVDRKRQEDAIGHLKDWCGATLLTRIDIPACRGYADARRKGMIGGGRRRTDKRGSDATIRRELNVLKAAANHALRWKRIKPNDMPTFEAPTEKRNRDEAPWFTKGEIYTLIAAAEDKLRDFIILAYWTGARRASIETLEVGQVRLETGRLHLDKPGAVVTKKRRPVVPIYPEMRPTLERLVARASEKGADGFLFGRSVDFYRPFARLCNSLGLDRKANPHVLRHSRATHMLMADESIYKVARLLGDTVATVERVYGHHSVEFLAEKEGVQ